MRFEGGYSSWNEAAAHSRRYDDANILERVLDASIQVKSGVAAFERDSVLFDEIQYSWPLTAGIMYAAARSEGSLHVLDFGGSLGSSYFQNRKFLDGLQDVRWSVVEQGHFVEAGRKHLQDERLAFYKSIDEATATFKPNIVLLSSVLQYLREPYLVLRKLLDLKPHLVLVDRTPFCNGSKDCLLVQHVPKDIYKASYPMWVINENMFLSKFYGDYEIVEDFVSPEGTIRVSLNCEMTFKGFIVRRVG